MKIVQVKQLCFLNSTQYHLLQTKEQVPNLDQKTKDILEVVNYVKMQNLCDMKELTTNFSPISIRHAQLYGFISTRRIYDKIPNFFERFFGNKKIERIYK